MKKLRFFGIVLFIFVLCLGSLGAQSLKGMSLNGSTGIYSIPSGRIGWERTSDFGLDLGYHAIFTDGYATHIPKVAASLFKWVELSAAFDIQPEKFRGSNGTDFIFGAKLQLPLKKTALGIGGNFQSLNLGRDPGKYNAGQIYVAATYAGSFFDWPAETTVVLGKTFIEKGRGWNDSDIDYGMGFDMVLLPDTFEGIVHWCLDFANFSYSVEPVGADSWRRGVLNTGLRFDLSRIKTLSKFKFVIDVLITDAFDDNRAFSIGLVFGVPIL